MTPVWTSVPSPPGFTVTAPIGDASPAAVIIRVTHPAPNAAVRSYVYPIVSLRKVFVTAAMLLGEHQVEMELRDAAWNPSKAKKTVSLVVPKLGL